MLSLRWLAAQNGRKFHVCSCAVYSHVSSIILCDKGLMKMKFMVRRRLHYNVQSKVVLAQIN